MVVSVEAAASFVNLVTKMTELRKRKLRDESESPAPPSPPPPRRASFSFKRVFLLLVVFALFITYLLGLMTSGTQLLDSVASRLGYEGEQHYAVIIDAGSSGSRVLAYKFRVPFSMFSHGGLELVEEYFAHSKPGLSSYADDPGKGAETIVSLIHRAEQLIPAHARSSTPLLVRATAGLRLLPRHKSDLLIQHVNSAISKLGYSVGDEAVQVMEGSDEGIFIWYTLNLLHNTMTPLTSMAALDLGGGSTQVTYRLDARDADAVPPQDTFLVPYAGENITLYTHSYLKLGLLAARYGILRLEAKDADTKNFTSACLDPIVQDEPWTYANQQYLVSGLVRPSGMSRVAAAERCASLARRYILATLDWEPQHPPRGTVAAMSYYYDVAADAGIIDVTQGGSVKIRAYVTEAQRACSNSNVDQPWACLDLIYVASLLHDGLKMPLDHTISLYKKVDGHEVSWALGLAYTTLADSLRQARAL